MRRRTLSRRDAVYPGADGAATLYEDDGRSFAYQAGAWMRIALFWTDRARRLRLSLAPGSGRLAPLPRTLEIRASGSAETRTVRFDGRTLSVRLAG